ncbi:unnamed protein product, partial [Sphenostylis stenocarpa]
NGSSTARKERNAFSRFASRVAGQATRAGFTFKQWGTPTMVGSFRSALKVSGLNSELELQTKELEGVKEEIKKGIGGYFGE